MTASLDSTLGNQARSYLKALICMAVAVAPWLLQTNPALSAPLTAPVVRISAPSFVYPLMGTRTSSDFGLRRHPLRKKVVRHHDGIDLAAPTGAIIRSVSAGRVVYADPWGGYGRLVVIKHEDGLTSHYGHCDTTSVQIGQRIYAGDIIGTVGSTGKSTGPHLHFEIRRNGKPLDPKSYLPGIDLPSNG